MKIKKILLGLVICTLIVPVALGLAACGGKKDSTVSITFGTIWQNGFENTRTTELEFLFQDPKRPGMGIAAERMLEILTIDNFTITGAKKGAMVTTKLVNYHDGENWFENYPMPTVSVAISNIAVPHGGNVTVTISSPAGYNITPATQSIAIHNPNFDISPETVDYTGEPFLGIWDTYVSMGTVWAESYEFRPDGTGTVIGDADVFIGDGIEYIYTFEFIYRVYEINEYDNIPIKLFIFEETYISEVDMTLAPRTVNGIFVDDYDRLAGIGSSNATKRP